MKYVGARIKDGRTEFSTANKKIRVVSDNFDDTGTLIKDAFHLYSVSDCGKYLILMSGNMNSKYYAPEEITLTEEQVAELSAAV